MQLNATEMKTFLTISSILFACLCTMRVCAQNEVQVTNLPTVYISTVNGVQPYDKEHELRCRVCIVDGQTRLIDSATVRLRGNASMNFPKKPYHIRFDTKHSVCGSPASARRWTLINNYGDKTLMRNLLAFDLSRRLEMPYTPFGCAVDVVVNGDFKGCYQLCDQIHVHKNRVEVDEGGFLIEADAYASDEDVWFTSAKGTKVSIHYPDADVITDAQKNTIKAQYNEFERSAHPNMDLETFLRHFLVGEISGNTDTYWSTYFYKRSTSDTIFTGPVWDFDLAFENDQRTFRICDHGDYVYRFGSTTGDMRNFVNNVVRKSPGQQRLAAIYAYYRDRDAISAPVLVAVIDSLENLLAQSAEFNFACWPILNTRVHQNPRAGGSFAQEVEWVREYIVDRIAWMDRKLNYTPTGMNDVMSTSTPVVSKQLRDGRVVILRAGAVYTVDGIRLE